MKNKRVSIKKFLENPKENSDNCYNFYDWFCKDTSLENRMIALVPKIKFLVKVGILDEENTYIWFKNNCPVRGSLYDDFRISDLTHGNYLGGFCPKTGHDVKNKCGVWFFEDGGFINLEFENWSMFKKEVKNNPELVKILVKAFSSK